MSTLSRIIPVCALALAVSFSIAAQKNPKQAKPGKDGQPPKATAMPAGNFKLVPPELFAVPDGLDHV